MAHPTSVDRLELGDHVCWTFEDENERLDATARFVGAGLLSGQRMLCDTAALSPGTLLAGLRARGVDVDRPVARGQVRVRDAHEEFLHDGHFDPVASLRELGWQVEQAQREGYTGVRIVHDMAWARDDAVGVERLAWYEGQVNRIVVNRWAVALCQYDRRLFAARDLCRAGTAHPGTTWGGSDSPWVPQLRMARTVDPPGLRLSGEIDISNHDAVVPVLEAVVADQERHHPTSPVVIDATELTFADASTAHLLIMAAQRAPAGLQLRRCTPVLAASLDALDAAEVPGLAVTRG